MVRTFPIRVAPLPGEALDSWLEAIAHRYGRWYSDLLKAVGLSAGSKHGHRTPWLFVLTAAELDTLTFATGVAANDLQSMTLSRFAHALDFDLNSARDTGTGSPTMSRSRYCPRCLAETAGRWQSRWRLGWSFVCLEHRCLLLDVCPSCGEPERRRMHPANCIPDPGKCANRSALGSRDRCGADLTEAETQMFRRGHPVLRAQAAINSLLDDEERSFGVYMKHPHPVHAVLADLSAVAVLALAYPELGEMAKHLPADLMTAYIEHGPCPAIGGPHSHRRRRRRPSLPPTPLTTAVAGVVAMQILGQPTITAAGRSMRWLMRRDGQQKPAVLARTTIGASRRTTDVLAAIQIKALAPLISPRDQLHYRHVADFPTAPAVEPATYAQMVRSIPSNLWPDWALRVAPRNEGYTCPAVLACAILLVGTNALVSDTVADLGSIINPRAANHLLLRMSRGRHWQEISIALLGLSDYLQEYPAPIDYARRRALDYTGLLPLAQWHGVCRDADVSRGNGLKLWRARSYLYEMLSGKPARCYSHPDTSSIPEHHAGRFALSLTPNLVRRLDHVAQCFLSDMSIDEPVTWQPPLTLLEGVPLAGLDPATVDLSRLRHLAQQPGSTVTGIARRLGLTPAAVCVLLAENPVGVHQVQSRRLRRSAAVRGELTAQTLLDLYHGQTLSTRAIGRMFGISTGLVRTIAAEHGITLSRVDFRTVPDILRPALVRPSGKLRLERFAAMIDFPSILAASEELGARGNLNHQIFTLERDLGAPLLNRSIGGQPMTPTPFGIQIAQAVRGWLLDNCSEA